MIGTTVELLSITINTSEADLGLLLLPALNYYHKAHHLGCGSSPRSASELLGKQALDKPVQRWI